MSGVASEHVQRRHGHSVYRRFGPERRKNHALRAGRAERSRNDEHARRQDRNVRFWFAAKLKRNIQVFVGPRRDPFFFDLAQFFKIVPDRNYMNHPHTPPATATSFRFASAKQKIILNGVDYGTAGSNGCAIEKPHDYLAPYDVLSIVIEMPKTTARTGRQRARTSIALWATTGTPNGRPE